MKQFIKRLNLIDWINYIYFIYLNLVTLLAWSRIPQSLYLLLANTAYLVFITLLVHYSRPDSHPVLKFVRCFYVLIFISFIYQETELYMRVYHREWLDPLITAFEHRIFGVYPTIWMQQIVSPALTELLKLSYASYFILLPFLPLYLYFKRDMGGFYHYLFTLTLALFICYVGFNLVPVVGPRYYWSDFAFEGRKYPFPFIRNPRNYTYEIKELQGFIFTRMVDRIMKNADVTGACIPSAHNAVVTVFLFGIRRYLKKWLYVVLPLVLSVYFATIYNRYHYVTDMVSGILVGLLAVWIGSMVFKANRIYLK